MRGRISERAGPDPDPRFAGCDRDRHSLASLRGDATRGLDLAIILRGLATVEHAVVANNENLPVSHFPGRRGVGRLPPLGGVRIRQSPKSKSLPGLLML